MLPEMKKLVQKKDLCVLATVSGSRPHCSLRAYVADEDCRKIYMVTLGDTKKISESYAKPGGESFD